MKFDIMTLFPDLVEYVLGESVIGRAQKAGFIEISTHNIRDYSEDKHRRVDDTPYGGGKGMLMMAPPIYRCYEDICKNNSEVSSRRVVFMSPSGKVLNQKKAEELSKYEHLIILCGHYEGVDQRIIDEIVDEEVSIGDFVLTGGEIPACILVDSVARLVEGVLSDPECYEKESISSGLIEYPQYTRPYEFHGVTVPEVLISGHHGNIDKWRYEQSIERTKLNRPDIYEEFERRNRLEKE
ncbi:MAG: tRNA (guanosine(37)-N1)-methyltransferase TrmD [Ruminococcaceae bacterium]|nr:tRNA (guanosine(37)-N1)-methyltransferase TrmD [Oscillospiraceae bacterium]